MHIANKEKFLKMFIRDFAVAALATAKREGI